MAKKIKTQITERTQKGHKTNDFRTLPATHTHMTIVMLNFNWTHTEILGQAQTKQARDYTEKNTKNVNEFCRCCNASLTVKYGHILKSVSIVNLLKPTIGQDSFEVLLQNIGIVCERGPEWSERLCGTGIKIKCAF